jgi:hypothetical protein
LKFFTTYLSSAVSRWCALLTAHSLPFDSDFLRLPLVCDSHAPFRAALHFTALPRVYENLSALPFLPTPVLVVDPLNVALEYVFKSTPRTGIIYCGDPDFDEGFGHLCDKFAAVIVRHFTFDRALFQKTLERAQMHTGLSVKVRLYALTRAGNMSMLPDLHISQSRQG